MSDDTHQPSSSYRAERSNGLAPTAPDPDQTILVAGGAGYIGCVLVPKLLDRGYRVRVLDRLYFGEEALAATCATRSSSSWPTCATCPTSALDGVDGVINLSGLSNDPTAEFNPEANWQMNAIATETLGPRMPGAGHRALRLRLLLLAVRRHAAGHARRGRRRSSRAPRTRPPSATARRGCSSSPSEGLCPVILRNGTVYGWSPRMRFDLVVNTFVKDALLVRDAQAARRRLDVAPAGRHRDCADAMIAAYEAPAEKVRGEIFNVVHSNYQIRELAMIVAGSVQLTGRRVSLEEVPAPKLTRDYECANAKLSTTLGFIPRRSVLEAVSDLLARIGDRGLRRRSPTRAVTTSAGSSCCMRSSRFIDAFSEVL